MLDRLTLTAALTIFAAALALCATLPVEDATPGAEATSAPSEDGNAGEGRTVALHDLRVKKCQRLVLTFYPHSGFLPYVDFFISEHERLGMGEAWYWSAVYGGANFSLQVGGRAPGNCAGPMDVKHYPRVMDPEANISWHCREMAGFYKRGVRGRDLCEHVFLPANPRDWQVRNGQGRFARTDAKFRECIERGYAYGKL